jgi:leucyl-tRNA synthetase
MDMFPYPSGEGLHVGHPLGFIGTDVFARYERMRGDNVLHTMGFDAFGLPAEQYAVQTGQHPAATTYSRIDVFKRQLRRMGLGHDQRRVFATTDKRYYRWTQWIFLQIFNSFYDHEANRARPITELVTELSSGAREPAPGTNPFGTPWGELSDLQRRQVIDKHRLAYLAESTVNWCPGLGTVLSNEEVTSEGRSERGNFPVFRKPLVQWMMRITAYADRLADDLDLIDWPDKVRTMQRNWIGRSTGAQVRFPSPAGDIESLHDPARHYFRRDLHGACSGAPDGRGVDGQRMAARHRPDMDRFAADAHRGGTGVSGGRISQRPSSTGRRTSARPASSPARSRRIQQLASKFRSSLPTTS